MSSALMGFSSWVTVASVGFQMQSPVALERLPVGLPIEAGLSRDVAKRGYDAFLHRLEAADVE